MTGIPSEEEDILARLETRIEALSQRLVTLAREKAEYDSRLRALSEERDQAMEQARAAREQADALREENEILRARQREAFSRIKALLEQVEQIELPGS